MKVSTVCASALVLFMLSPVHATSDTKLSTVNQLLKGQFAFVSTEQCAHSQAGFGAPPMLQPLGPVNREWTTVQGILTLHGDGTGNFDGMTVSLGTAPDFTPIVKSALRCSVTYQLKDDSSFRMERKCEGTRLLGTGSHVALTWAASPIHATGYLHGDTLAMADTEVSVEKILVSGVTSPRLCHRNSSATKIKKLK